jgi:hypothetical protein
MTSLVYSHKAIQTHETLVYQRHRAEGAVT